MGRMSADTRARVVRGEILHVSELRAGPTFEMLNKSGHFLGRC